MSASEGPTPVTIYGKTYHLRGEGDPRYLHSLAKEVDRRMRDVAETTGTADTLKVAILAALNITDDCMQARSVPASSDVEADLGRLAARIDEVLADPGCRPHRAEAGRSDGHA
ncbi:MAG TPA: cell division protein ZapA [Candidatus Polarisedimenticolaceae bacterium]|nr:cell division protein ZapA [Candidatus Polarisedimenticolaceae bacterium]